MLSVLIRSSFRNMSTPSKLTKLSKYIGTHDNTFHCDDVTACFMLKQLDRFKDHEIIRTRDPELLASAEIIVDVGSELDVEKLRLDHHQHTFKQTIRDYHPNMKTTNMNKPPRLSSSGLVYAIFGKDVIVKLLGLEGGTYANLVDEKDKKMVDAIYQKAYIELFEEIDAIDNGVEMAEGDNLVYNYCINSGISNRVGRINPRQSDNPTAEKRLELFHKAMEMVGEEIVEGIKFLGQYWWPARQNFRKFIEKRKEFDPSGEIVFVSSLDTKSNGIDMTGWRGSILELEEEMGIVGECKYIVYENPEAFEAKWRALAVPINSKSFTTRVPLKKDWCGKRNEELQAVSGVEDATFVHNNGFTGGAKSKAGIISLIRKSLAEV